MAVIVFVSTITKNYFLNIIPQVTWCKIAPLIIDLSFSPTTTQIKDFALMIVMSSWNYLDWHCPEG